MSKQRASQSFQISDGAHSRGRRMDQAEDLPISCVSCGGRRSKKRSALCKSDGLGRLREVSRQTIVRSALTSQR